MGVVFRKKQRQLNLLLVNLAYIMEGADVAILPAVYRDLGNEMFISPTGLGSLTLARKVVEMVCFPLSAVLATSYDRAFIIAAGVTVWAISTAAVGFSQNFLQVAVTRAVSGVGIALVAPAICSMVADSSDTKQRGLSFGLLHLMGTLGHWLGGTAAILLAGTTVGGVQGWRLVFFLAASLSQVLAVMVYGFVVDTTRTDVSANFSVCVSPSTSFSLASKVGSKRSLRSQLAEFLSEARKVVNISSFQVIVGQGIPGTFPLSAAAFFPMWLELVGFSHDQTAALQTVFLISRALGAVGFGLLSDYVALLLPHAGRIMMGQVSTGSAIFISAVLLLGLRRDPSAIWEYSVALFMLGVLTSSISSATNSPIFAEIVHKEYRTTVYALDHFFEALLAAFATPVVGLLAERLYGYVRPPKDRPRARGSYQVDLDKHNANSLAKALYLCFGAPYALCTLIYSLLYWTYPRDRDRIRWEVSQVQLLAELGQSDVEEMQPIPSQVYKQVVEEDEDEEDDEDETVDESDGAESSLETAHMLRGRS